MSIQLWNTVGGLVKDKRLIKTDKNVYPGGQREDGYSLALTIKIVCVVAGGVTRRTVRRQSQFLAERYDQRAATST